MGSCKNCGANAGAFRTCNQCRRVRACWQARREFFNVAKGKCRCGKPRVEGAKSCSTCAARSNRNQSRYAVRIRSEIINLLGGKCFRCNVDDRRVLQIDHVNDDGKKERGRDGCSSVYYRKIKEGLIQGRDDLRCVCANCHLICADERRRLRKASRDDEFAPISSESVPDDWEREDV